MIEIDLCPFVYKQHGIAYMNIATENVYMGSDFVVIGSV